MAEPCSLSPKLAGISSSSNEFWRESAGGGWATAVAVLLLLLWRLFRAFSRRRSVPLGGESKLELTLTPSSVGNTAAGISHIISDAELNFLIIDLRGELKNGERWEDVIDKKNDHLSYKVKCCRTKDGPLKYLSITTFEKCSAELLRDFYMDNEYRTLWDKTLIKHEQLQVDEMSGTEVGRMLKKFPFMTPREYVLAWRVWEGRDKTFYCYIKDCEHSLAPRQKKYVRVKFFRSGWCIRKVPGRDACEIMMVHQEDASLNLEIAKLAFSKGIWSYVCKMNNALRDYSSHNQIQSPSIMTMLRLIQKVPPKLVIDARASHHASTAISGASTVVTAEAIYDELDKTLLGKPTKKWIGNGLLLLGGVFCLSRGRSTLGTQLALACILNKLVNHGSAASGQVEPTQVARLKTDVRHRD